MTTSLSLTQLFSWDTAHSIYHTSIPIALSYFPGTQLIPSITYSFPLPLFIFLGHNSFRLSHIHFHCPQLFSWDTTHSGSHSVYHTFIPIALSYFLGTQLIPSITPSLPLPSHGDDRSHIVEVADQDPQLRDEAGHEESPHWLALLARHGKDPQERNHPVLGYGLHQTRSSWNTEDQH